MNFKVEAEFQHEGITYEVGNTHTKHGLSNDEVQSFKNAGWVDIGTGHALAANNINTQIQPDDITIVLNPEVGNG